MREDLLFLMNSIAEKIIASIVSAIFSAVMFFVIRRNFFQTKNISGQWNLRIKILESTYNPYIGLQIDYIVHLLLQGDRITGRGEKVRDVKPTRELHYEYPNKDRVSFDLVGTLEKNYFKSSKINLQITEAGTERITSTSYSLILKNSNFLEGTFESTAANSKGEASWTRRG